MMILLLLLLIIIMIITIMIILLIINKTTKALSEAVKIADELGDHDELAQYLITLSNAKAGLKDHAAAYEKGHSARALLRRSRNRRAEGTAFLNLCGMYATQGNLRKAVAMGKEAQILFARTGGKRGEVDALFMLVQILIAGGTQELAVKWAKRGQELLQELGGRLRSELHQKGHTTTGHRLFCKESLCFNTMPCRHMPFLVHF